MPPIESENESFSQDANLRRVVLDAAYFGGMVGCGETYIPAFALAIGLSESNSGVVASVPLLAGGIIQLLSPIAIRWAGSLRRWVVSAATLQALSFVPLVFAAFHGNISLSMLILVSSLYWAAGYSTGPAWNTWMEHIVPSHQRVKFFAGRSRVQQSCTLAALLLSGVFLNWGASRGYTLESFAVLFAFAGVLRLVSANYLRLTKSKADFTQLPSSDHQPFEEPLDRQRFQRSTAPIGMHSGRAPAPRHNRLDGGASRHSDAAEPVSRSDSTVNKGGKLSAKRLILYLVCMQVFIQVSGPFFAPYMLKQLNIGYAAYVGLISVAFVSKVLSLAFWGRVAEKLGVLKVLWIGGIGLVPLATLWIASTNLWWLVCIQVVSGFAWSAYELGFFLMFFESLPSNQRTRLLTYYNFASTLAICVGASIGAAILACTDCTPEAYHRLFVISSIGRFACLGLLVGLSAPSHTIRSIALRILSVRPGAGSVSAPIIASEDRTTVPTKDVGRPA